MRRETRPSRRGTPQPLATVADTAPCRSPASEGGLAHRARRPTARSRKLPLLDKHEQHDRQHVGPFSPTRRDGVKQKAPETNKRHRPDQGVNQTAPVSEGIAELKPPCAPCRNQKRCIRQRVDGFGVKR